MTAFSMRAWSRLVEALLCGLLLLAAPALADTFEAREAQLEAQDDAWTVSAEYTVELNARVEEAVSRGVPLYFNFEFELIRPRWYWLDEKTVQATQVYRLSYHALTRQYRLSAGTLYQSFSSLGEALRVLGRPRMQAFDKSRVRAGESYVAAVRLRLDVTQLPRPFQVSALTNRDWTLESEWRRFAFRPDGAGVQR
ncbi:MAG: DUF4390 domain-containing protein [Burkholderiales bacterium]